MLNRLRPSEGFTLTELLIALTILGLVISVAYSMQSYGIASFARGESLATQQANVRMVSGTLSEQIRFAREVTIHADLPNPYESGYTYFWADNEGDIVQSSEAGSTKIIIASARDATYSLEFTIYNDGTNGDGEGDQPATMVEFTVTSQSSQGRYELTTSVLALNFNEEILNPISGGVLGVRRP